MAALLGRIQHQSIPDLGTSGVSQKNNFRKCFSLVHCVVTIEFSQSSFTFTQPFRMLTRLAQVTPTDQTVYIRLSKGERNKYSTRF